MACDLAAAMPDVRVAEAAKNGDVAGLQTLLKQGADPNGRLGDGATALHWVAYRDDRDTTELLLLRRPG